MSMQIAVMDDAGDGATLVGPGTAGKSETFEMDVRSSTGPHSMLMIARRDVERLQEALRVCVMRSDRFKTQREQQVPV
jgi:hypothetical protein